MCIRDRDNGFRPFAGAAFVGEHSFSKTLAAGRPDVDDLLLAAQFAGQAAARLAGVDGQTPPVEVPGRAREARTYYQPRDRAGNPVDIRKVKPDVYKRQVHQRRPAGCGAFCGYYSGVCQPVEKISSFLHGE